MAKTHKDKFASKRSTCTNSTDATRLLAATSTAITRFSQGDDTKAKIVKMIETEKDELKKMMAQDYLSRLTGADDSARIVTYDASGIWLRIREHFDGMFKIEGKLEEASAAQLLDVSKALTKLYNDNKTLFPTPEAEKRA